jgi:hypothetical protein
MPITEEEKEQLWEECLEIWDPIVMCGDKIWAMMNNGVPEEMLAIVIK